MYVNDAQCINCYYNGNDDENNLLYEVSCPFYPGETPCIMYLEEKKCRRGTT